MKSLKHVLWRGALAMGLVTLGLGSGLGVPAEEPDLAQDGCAATPNLAADQSRTDTAVVVRIAISEAVNAG